MRAAVFREGRVPVFLIFLRFVCRDAGRTLALDYRGTYLKGTKVKNLQKIRSVFCEALEKETQEQREAYLSQACRNDSALRAEVEALLRAQSKADDFFKNPLVGPET